MRSLVMLLSCAALAASVWTSVPSRAALAAPLAADEDLAPSVDATAAPGSALALGVYQPVFPNNLRGLEDYEARAGQRADIVHWFALWGGWKREFSRGDLEAVHARGSTPLISWEPWAGVSKDPAWSLREAVLSGQNDAYIASWAAGLAAYGKPVLLRFAHEMHHQHYPWALGVNDNTADEYVAAWRHVRQIFDQHGVTNVQWVWNPNTLGRSSAEIYLPIYQSLYPGDAYVDWVGLDIYNTGPMVDWGAPEWRSFSQVLSEPYRAIAQVSSRPLILPEVGSTEVGGSKAAWIQEALGPEVALQFPQLRALVWFDVNKEADWGLRSSPAALDAWALSAAAASPDARALALRPLFPDPVPPTAGAGAE